MPIKENEIIIPALVAMAESPNGEITTTSLISYIQSKFHLDEQDQEYLQNRNDQKFSQIVHNLKSHKTLRDKGYAEEIDGGFRILPRGRQFLIDNGLI